ncbi:hypothetical protein CDAR_59301 [Caerostris darwini]|uniref:Uncharacterized protein n=1 Tax=Caerostris darwini TaxID=1538125 RepID=A0AAV4X640_9ARAC|nr:hypothetical protein CDAR_59301 [Caerostris darwini]
MYAKYIEKATRKAQPAAWNTESRKEVLTWVMRYAVGVDFSALPVRLRHAKGRHGGGRQVRDSSIHTLRPRTYNKKAGSNPLLS